MGCSERAIVAVTGLLAAAMLLSTTWLRAQHPSMVLSTTEASSLADTQLFGALELSPVDAYEAKVDNEAALGGGLSCHAREHYDLSGDAAFVWGLTFHVRNAVECGRACAAHQRLCSEPNAQGRVFWKTDVGSNPQEARCGRPGPKVCNSFVFCPEPRCFSYTPHEHGAKGGGYECWLKHESNVTHPVASGPKLPPEMRDAPRKHWPWAVEEKVWPGKPPEYVQWTTGIVVPKNEPVWIAPQKPSWHTKFCTGAFGPCSD
mmetsp:Transcript_11365/g.38767  ORF Transcript_11365/g.38767 Transcript_11365/m.38767 type:complete len:260 (-) Transcript_11365:194-973(-)